MRSRQERSDALAEKKGPKAIAALRVRRSALIASIAAHNLSAGQRGLGSSDKINELAETSISWTKRSSTSRTTSDAPAHRRAHGGLDACR